MPEDRGDGTREEPGGPGLPRRPRSHTLEDESRLAFRQWTPMEWSPRPVDPDYGVDLDVEVFENERPTGLFFYVQLRATDSERGDALTVRFRPEQWAYFRLLDRPVLVVRYHASTRSLYGRWAHQVDADLTQPSVPVRMGPDDLLGPESATQVVTELRGLHCLLDGRLPLTVRLSTSDDSARSAGSLRLAAAAIMRDEGWLRIDADSSTASGCSVEVHPHKVIVQVGTIRSHVELPDGTLESQAADLLTALAFGLFRAKQYETAATVLLAAVPFGRLIESRYVDIGGSLLKAPIAQVLDLARTIAAAGHPLGGLRMTDLPVTMKPGGLSGPEVASVTEFLTEVADEWFADDLPERSRRLYTLANWLFERVGSWEASAKRYGQALAEDPRYGDRPYFCFEYGAALFECGRYQDAIGWYKKALILDRDPRLHPRLADCHFRAGDLVAAMDCMAAYFAEADEHEDFWILLSMVLAWIVPTFGLDRQDRNPDAAAAALGLPIGPDDPQPTRAQALEAISLDYLFEPAWVCLARPCVDPDDPDDCDYVAGLMTVMTLAVIDGEPWTSMAVMHAASGEDPELLDRLVRYGVKGGDRGWVSRILTVSETCPEPEKSNLQQALERLTTGEPRHERVMRFHNDDGSWETLRIFTSR
jgi:tetratricopeptide (TPR) repeat protein